jgi:hypothetical protein
MGRCSSPTLWWRMPHFSRCYKPSPLQAHWGRRCHTCLLWPVCLFTVCVRECPSPALQWSFPHYSRCYKLSPLQGCWVGAAPAAFSSQLVYLQFDWGVPPHSPELRAPCPLCYVSFFFNCLFITQFFFSFFPGWGGSVCPGGYADLFQGCLWEYCMPLSSPGGLLFPSRLGAGIWQHRSPPGFSI